MLIVLDQNDIDLIISALPPPEPPTDWMSVANTIKDVIVPEIVKNAPQKSSIEIYPDVALTVEFSATFGELLISTLLMFLIALIVSIFLYNLILKRVG